MSRPAAHRLHVERSGSGSPLVLLHGLGASVRSWSQLLPFLTERHEVLAVDLPGHGASPPLPDEMVPSVETLTDVIDQELDEQLPTPTPVVGNSLGGEIALELAARGRVSGVVAISPSGLSTTLERFSIKTQLRTGHMVARTLAPWRDLLAPLPAARTALFANIRARPWRMTTEETATELDNLARPVYLQTLHQVEDRSAATGLPKIGCPVLIAFGTLDLLLGAHQAPRFVNAIDGARLAPLPWLGHVPMSDDPALVAGTILEFVEDALER